MKEEPRRTIFGLDILPMESPSAKFAPRYALVIMQNGLVVKRFEEVSKPYLINLIQEHKPDLLAVDNVYELEKDWDCLKSFASILPIETSIVQVTGTPDNPLTLQEMAARYKLKLPPRLSPLDEATTSARLAELGAGCLVQFFEEETKILVTRNVSLGPGGSSQSRYRRRIHSSILNITRKIEDRLRGMNFDYDLSIVRSEFGLKRGEFTVYAPRTSLYGVVKPRRGSYTKVEVRPVFREHVEFLPRKEHERGQRLKFNPLKKLIVGVDPGTTCGLAVLTLDSTPIHVESRRGLTRGDITRILTKLGKPVIIAADVTPAPSFVEELAKGLNAVLFTPSSDLETMEKRDVAQIHAQQFNVNLKKSHEVDALFAAVKAFQHYKNKFEQVEKRVIEAGVCVPVDDVKELVVRGHSIQRAIEELTPRPGTEAEKPEIVELERRKAREERVEREVKSLRKKVLLQKSQIEHFKKLNLDLQLQVKELKAEIARLLDRLEKMKGNIDLKIMREKRYQILRRDVEGLRKRLGESQLEIQRYKGELEESKRYRELESRREVTFLKPIETFTKSGLDRAFKFYNIKMGDAVFLLNASGGGASTSDKLAKKGVRVVVVGTPMASQAEEKLREHGIPVIPSKALEIKWVEGYPYAKTSEVEKVISEAAESEKARAIDGLTEMVEEYRKERLKAPKGN